MKLFKKIKEIRLNKTDKKAVRDNLVLFMKEHPSVISEDRGRLTSYTRSNSFFPLSVNKLILKPMPIIIILALMIGSGTSLAAQGAMPGDVLYPVKLSVNERVASWVAVSDEAQADWEVRVATRRLQEAEELSSEGRLDAKALATIEAKFDAHADKVSDRIEEFKAKEDFEAAIEVASNFEVSLRAHEKILSHMGEEGSVASKVRIEIEGTNKDRVEVETHLYGKASGSDSAEGKLKAAKNKIEEVKKFIERVKASLGAEAVVEAEARLKIAEGLVAKSEAKIQAKAYGEAFVLAQRAHSTAQSAKLLVKAEKDLKIRITPCPLMYPSPCEPKITPPVSRKPMEPMPPIGVEGRSDTKIEFNFGF